MSPYSRAADLSNSISSSGSLSVNIKKNIKFSTVLVKLCQVAKITLPFRSRIVAKALLKSLFTNCFSPNKLNESSINERSTSHRTPWPFKLQYQFIHDSSATDDVPVESASDIEAFIFGLEKCK